MLIVKSYYLFLTNPKKHYSLAKGKNPISVFITVLIITYDQIFLIALLPLRQSISSSQPPFNTPVNFWILFFIPLYEELMFRLPLRVSALHIRISLSLFLLSALLIIISTVIHNDTTLVMYYLLVFGTAIAIFLILKNINIRKSENIFFEHYNYIFYLSIFIFTSLHFYHVSFSLSAAFIYIIYGYSLSFLRVSTSFPYNLILHFIFIIPSIVQLSPSFFR